MLLVFVVFLFIAMVAMSSVSIMLVTCRYKRGQIGHLKLREKVHGFEISVGRYIES